MTKSTPIFNKIFATIFIFTFSIVSLFVGITNTQTKTASAFELSILTACENAADYSLYYENYETYQIKSEYCSSTAIRSLVCNLSDGFNCDQSRGRTCNFTLNQGFTNCGYNNCNYQSCYNNNYNPYYSANNNCIITQTTAMLITVTT
jgi:hypothetical protein